MYRKIAYYPLKENMNQSIYEYISGFKFHEILRNIVLIFSTVPDLD